MNRVNTVVNPSLDLVVSHSRSQMTSLKDVLAMVEEIHNHTDEYVHTSLKSIEDRVHRLKMEFIG